MIFVIFQVVGGLILRGALTLAVIVNDQVARQAHQPVLQVALFGIVLFEGSVDTDKDILSQILSTIGTRSEAISQIVYAARISLHNLFPGRAITGATSPHQFSAFIGSQASRGSHCYVSDSVRRLGKSGHRLTRQSYACPRAKVPSRPTSWAR